MNKRVNNKTGKTPRSRAERRAICAGVVLALATPLVASASASATPATLLPRCGWTPLSSAGRLFTPAQAPPTPVVCIPIR